MARTKKRFYRLLYKECDGLIETRNFGRDQRFWKIDQIQTGLSDYLKRHRNRNLYYAVATRDGHGGKKSNIVSIPAVWCDLDFKDFEDGEHGAASALIDFKLDPSALIHSGNGLHIYWFLKTPLSNKEIPVIENINRRIAWAMNGDPNAVDASRVLRIPGSYNLKDEKPKRVKIRQLDDARYTLDDFSYLPEPEHIVSKSNYQTIAPEEQLRRVLHCKFVKYCYKNAETLPEPLWYAMLSNVARIYPGGITLCHFLSEKHPKYSKQETNQKILQALDNAGPHRCEWIRAEGFDGCGTCPAIDRTPIYLINHVRGNNDNQKKKD